VSTLKITEIFYSLQGESSTVGIPTTFIRLTGCPLRCHYCDTTYAFKGGTRLTLDEITTQVAATKTRYVCVTGGEPLAQKNCLPLLAQLCDSGYKVSLETSGAISLDGVDKRVLVVMDLKTPDSGEANKNLWSNLDLLKQTDELKIVICSQNDYLWFKEMAETHQLFRRCNILLSPGYGQISARQLAQWILQDRLPVRFQMQLHKLLWDDAPGH
jgi:7-carboxy-7-deazaguanine synthase